jgi:hypothetical protein
LERAAHGAARLFFVYTARLFERPHMADETPKPRDREGARRRAQNHFAVAEQRDTTVKQMMQAERAAIDAKTAKLRALRLAKEETDRADAVEAAKTAKTAKPAAAKKARAAK